MDQHEGKKNKEKVPLSDCEEDENENEYEDFNLEKIQDNKQHDHP